MIIPTLLGVSLLIFTILSFTPGNPGEMALGQDAPQEVIYEYNEKLGDVYKRQAMSGGWSS